MDTKFGLMCPLQAYLVLAAILFCTGVWGLIQQPQCWCGADEIEFMLNASTST